jgi:hypothetical protein
VSPLLLELSFTLLRWYVLPYLSHPPQAASTPSFFHILTIYSGCVGLEDQKRTSYPKLLERILQYTRLPILLAVILIIVAGSVLNVSYLKAGAVVLAATFIYLSCTAIVILVSRLRKVLSAAGKRGLWLAIASLPFFAARVIYLLLVEFGNEEFDPVVGDWRWLVGMGFGMEVGIVVLLVAAGVALEGFWGDRRHGGRLSVDGVGKNAEVGVQGGHSV